VTPVHSKTLLLQCRQFVVRVLLDETHDWRREPTGNLGVVRGGKRIFCILPLWKASPVGLFVADVHTKTLLLQCRQFVVRVLLGETHDWRREPNRKARVVPKKYKTYAYFVYENHVSWSNSRKTLLPPSCCHLVSNSLWKYCWTKRIIAVKTPPEVKLWQWMKWVEDV